MQAVILAAGEGTRLRPLTLDKPKPLVEINGRSILEYIMDNLIGFVDEIILVIGYKGEKIKEKFGDSFKGVKLKYVEQGERLGNAHALSLAKQFLDGKFIVMNGDDLYLKKDVEKCLKHELCVLARKVDNPERFGIITLKENNIIDEFIEKPKEFIGDLANTGCCVLNKKIFDEIEILGKSERGEYELSEAIRNLAQKEEVRCVEAEFFFPIAYPEDIEKAGEILGK